MTWSAKKAKKTILITAALLIGAGALGPAGAADQYQNQVLFSPSSATLEWEAGGRVMIYDGLKYTTVMRAMDEHFDRIENMMFVRTVYEQDDGEELVEEDGCD